MEAIILAGGMGTRLKAVLPDIPKPLAPIGDKPFLGYLLKYLEDSGIDSVILAVGYKYECLEEYFGNCYGRVSLKYSVEDKPLGTGGATQKALAMASGNEVAVLNGDTFFRAPLAEMRRKHLESDSEISVALKPMRQVSRYGNVIVAGSKIVKFEEKAPVGEGLINGGVYIFNKKVFERFELPARFSLEADFFQRYVGELRMAAFISDEYFIDIGLPEDYYKSQQELAGFL
ncbi:MAG: nucleotidyltransferase family protein [Firmicutes bacterium]|nr:nucleotidyltransferase family protein [Bacillota bacterium]